MARAPWRPLQVAALVASLVMAVAALAPVGVARAGAAGQPYCGISWGSLEERSPGLTPAPLAAARFGRHPCFERLVFDLAGTPAPGYVVRYVDHVLAPGSGLPVPVPGGARLEVDVGAPAYDALGNPTLTVPAGGVVADLSGWQTFRQLRFGASFEGHTVFALGVRARLPFRAFTLPGPGAGSRLVIDVAHLW